MKYGCLVDTKENKMRGHYKGFYVNFSSPFYWLLLLGAAALVVAVSFGLINASP